MPMDNSTDPAFRDLTLENVEADFGSIEGYDAQKAYDVLTEVISSPPWMRREESNSVLIKLIHLADIQNDPDELANLGLEDIDLE